MLNGAVPCSHSGLSRAKSCRVHWGAVLNRAVLTEGPCTTRGRAVLTRAVLTRVMAMPSVPPPCTPWWPPHTQGHPQQPPPPGFLHMG